MTENGRPVADGDDRDGRQGQDRSGGAANAGHTDNGHTGVDDAGFHQGTGGQGAEQDDPAQRGRMRYQDPDSTTPREPTLAEKRARLAAEKRREEAEEAERAAAARKTQMRRRVMIGGGATVGVVALVAAFYTAAQPAEATANCVVDNPQTNQPVVQPDEYCDQNYARQHGQYNPSTGLWMMPLFLGGGPSNVIPHSQYRHSYSTGGAASPGVGQTVTNPNYTKPDNANIKSKSGTTIERGGFGFKGGSSGS